MPTTLTTTTTTIRLKQIQKMKRKRLIKNIGLSPQTTWDSIAKKYEMIQGVQLSNSFTILMAFDENEDPLTTTQIS